MMDWSNGDWPRFSRSSDRKTMSLVSTARIASPGLIGNIPPICCRRRLHAAGFAFEKREGEFRFQIGDVMAQRRLCHTGMLRGPGQLRCS
jgi:hypothetical protein